VFFTGPLGLIGGAVAGWVASRPAGRWSSRASAAGLLSTTWG